MNTRTHSLLWICFGEFYRFVKFYCFVNFYCFGKFYCFGEGYCKFYMVSFTGGLGLKKNSSWPSCSKGASSYPVDK